MDWKNTTRVREVLDTLARYTRKEEAKALRKVGELTGDKGTTRKSLQLNLRKSGIRAYASLFKPEEKANKGEEGERSYEKFTPLVRLTKKGPVTLEEVCDKLGLTPGKAKKFIEEAIKSGIKVKVNLGHVGMDYGSQSTKSHGVSLLDPMPTDNVAPTVGYKKKVAVISDLHSGSKYCLRAQIKEFIHYAYGEGVRTILIPGDVLEGCYRHAAFELTHVGLDDQTRDLIETLPQLKGLSYHAITGNHDFTFTEKIGVDVGSHITWAFKKAGRNDITFYGDRSAFLEVEGATFHLWHPCRGVGHTKSYQLQKQIERYTALKPQVLLTGHWHIYCEVYERGVHGIACPTFQGGGSAFGKSLGGSPAIGGLILSWTQTAEGHMRGFSVEKRFYLEVEDPIKIKNDLDAIPIPRLG